MKNIWQILTVLLAGALCILVVKNTFSSIKDNEQSEIATPQDTQNAVLENIMSRSSVRKYSDKPIEQHKIDKLLRAAMAAPSAGNKQPWAIVVVDDKEILARLAQALPYAKMTEGAALAMVVCGDLSKGFQGKESEYWIHDCSAMSENILLAAHAMGLGAVWTGVYPMDERVEAVKTELGLPENIIPLNVIPMGYPVEENIVKDKWNPSAVKYNRW